MPTILIVDDLSTNRDVLISILRHRGHRLLVAGNGDEALAIACAERPDLVITDVLMPVMDGYELVKQLRQLPETERIPVVFYTAHYGEREARALALSSGVSDVLTKPVEPDEVIRVVERALSEPTGTPSRAPTPQLIAEFDREHLRLVTDKLSDKARDLTAANARLRALINIGLELASERDTARLLQKVAIAARDLFGATYATLGLVDKHDRTLERIVVDGTHAGGWIRTGDTLPGLLATVITERRTVRGDNPDGDPHVLGLPGDHPSIRSYLATPIASPAQVYGWLCLVSNEERPFTEDDEALVAALSGQVGRIYENGYFYALARAERDRAQRYLDTARVVLLGLDLQGRITLVNQYACTLFGWTAEELSGRDFFETCVPAGSREKADLREVLLSDRTETVTAPIVTKDGEQRVVEWRSTVLSDVDGRPMGTLSSGSDVTERARAEAQVRLQTAALTAAANAVVITDATGAIEWVNPAFEEMTGYTAAEAIGRNPGNLVKSGQHDRAFYKTLWDTILAGQVWHGEIINRRKNGGLYHEEQSITPVRGNDGTIEHFIAIKQDVSGRKRYEEELRERTRLAALTADVGLALNQSATVSQALQQCAEALVTHLGAAFGRIWTLNENQTLELRASAGLYTHLDGGHSRVLVGQFKIGRIAQTRRPHLSNTVLEDPEVSDHEWARREGMVAFAGHPLVVGDRLLGVMAIFARHSLSDSVVKALGSVAHHIALGIERHRSGHALQDAEERMRFALESAQIGIWDVDYTTGVVRWSEILERHCGLASGTFGGTFDAFMDVVHPDDRPSIRALIDSASVTGSDFALPDFRVLWPDRTVHWLSGAGRIMLGAQGEAVRGVGIALDVSARRTLEEQYHQAQKMEAIGRLAGGVAHDFNNLLTAILGYCELLLAELDDTDPRRPDLLEIQKAGGRAAGLTRQLLAFSRKQIIEPTTLDLNNLVADIKSLLSRLIGEDIDIRLKLSPDVNYVRADRGQIEQVLLNLAVNARDAMPQGGTLTIETANVELDENYVSKHFTAKPGPHVMIGVIDNGTGMTPEVQARLFEPFFTTKGLGKGTGLGLATVHGIVSQAGGSIGVYSEPNKGTAFKVYLPRTDAAGAALKVEPGARIHRGTQTILVVEDAKGLRELTKRLLARQGYTVLTAGDADEAVRLFEQNESIDILLTDVVMPGASGPELTRTLLDRRPSLKVIYMSGYTDEAIVHHGVLAPDVAFLQKPFTSDTLARKLREVLEG